MPREFATAATKTKVIIDVGGWDDTIALKSAISRELANANLQGININNLMNMQLDVQDLQVGPFAQMVLLVDSSPAVYEALFRCLGRCTYNGQKISKGTFEPVAAREDYYEIVIACLQENIGPFFGALLSKLKTLGEKLAANSQTSQPSQ